MSSSEDCEACSTDRALQHSAGRRLCQACTRVQQIAAGWVAGRVPAAGGGSWVNSQQGVVSIALHRQCLYWQYMATFSMAALKVPNPESFADRQTV